MSLKQPQSSWEKTIRTLAKNSDEGDRNLIILIVNKLLLSHHQQLLETMLEIVGEDLKKFKDGGEDTTYAVVEITNAEKARIRRDLLAKLK